MSARPIPEATVGRLPVYLRALVEMAESGATTVSSENLAEAAGVNSAKLRKDLSHLGSYGTRGVGYDIAYLIHQVRRELGLTQHWPVVIAGKIEIRPMMYLALSYDHRIVDGREAVTFLVRVKECLEDPARLVLDL